MRKSISTVLISVIALLFVLSAGSSYNMYKDVSVSGGSGFEGLYYSMPTVGSSSSSGSFTAE